MKKFGLYLCVFAAAFAVFITLAYVRIGDKPGDVAIENAVAWAKALEASESFKVAGTDINCDSLLHCTTYVANAYGQTDVYNHMDSVAFWIYAEGKHPGDWNAPRGSLVLFDANEHNERNGHIALCTGDGKLMQAGAPLILSGTIAGENDYSPYVGWVWPPKDWPGRSDNLQATALVWARQAIKAAIITAAVWAVLFVIGRVKKKRSEVK